MKVISEKFYPVFNIYDIKADTTRTTLFGQGHDTMGEAFEEGIRHHLAHPKGRELTDTEGDEFIRCFDWTVQKQYTWVGNHDSDARKYIGE